MLTTDISELSGSKKARKELQTLAETYIETKDNSLIEAIFLGVIDYVHSFRKRVPLLSKEDYYSDANYCVWLALSTYKVNKGCKFITYFCDVLKNETFNHNRKLRAVKRGFATMEISIDSTVPNADNVIFSDILGDTKDFDTIFLSRYITNDLLSSRRFSKKEKEVFKLRFIDGYTLKQLVTLECYKSHQTAGRACRHLKNKIQRIYGGTN